MVPNQIIFSCIIYHLLQLFTCPHVSPRQCLFGTQKKVILHQLTRRFHHLASKGTSNLHFLTKEQVLLIVKAYLPTITGMKLAASLLFLSHLLHWNVKFMLHVIQELFSVQFHKLVIAEWKKKTKTLRCWDMWCAVNQPTPQNPGEKKDWNLGTFC